MNTQEHLASPQGVLVLNGYSLRVAVERGHLVVEDGVGCDRRSGRFPRAMPGFERLVVIGHSGTVTLEALRWLHELGIAFVQLGRDGDVIVAAGPERLNDGRLRRAQALAPGNGLGLRLMRDVVQRKLVAQRSVAERLDAPPDMLSTLSAAANTAQAVDGFEELRLVEAQGALAYWEAWRSVQLTFARRDERRVAAHWLRGTARQSPLTGKPRTAAHPLNALLNYLYAVLEAEARLACLAMGLDPALGLLHADLRARDSLALDLMEPVRPSVDATVLDLVRDHIFSREDFFETRQGVCRVLPPLAAELAATGPRWAHELGPLAEWLAREFLANWAQPPELDAGKAPRRPRRVQDVPTVLTQERRSRAQGIHQRSARAAPGYATVTRRCPVCGHRRGRGMSGRCPSCAAAHRLESVARAVATRVQKRALGHDYTRAGRRSLSAKQRANKRAEAAWRAAHPEGADREAYRREIMPRLRDVRTVDLHRALGIARPRCVAIREGRHVPHPRHWDKLRALVAEV